MKVEDHTVVNKSSFNRILTAFYTFFGVTNDLLVN